MELLYLRIFDTKTDYGLAFANKDINFSGKHHFSIDEKSGKIKYSEHQNYNQDLYGKNTSVTGLIGSNGVGKTTFLKFLQYLIAKLENFEKNHAYQYFDNWEWIAIVNTKDGLAVTHGHEYMNLPDEFDKEFKPLNLSPFVFQPIFFDNLVIEPIIGLSSSISYSPHIDWEEPNFDNPDYINVSSDFILYHENAGKEGNDQNVSQVINFRKSEIKRQIAFMQFAEAKENEDIQFYKNFNREKINVQFNQFIKKFDSEPRYIDFGDIELYKKLDEQFLKYSNDLNYRLRRKKSGSDDELAKLWFYKRLFEIIFYNVEYRGETEIQDSNFRLKISEKFEFNDMAFENLKMFLKNLIILGEGKKIKFLMVLDEVNSIFETNLEYTEDDLSFTCSLDVAKKLMTLENQILNLLPYNLKLPLFVFDWQGMSTGEKAYLNLFSRLHHGINLLESHLKIKESKKIYFLIDEPSTGFHPQWQKQYLNKLISFLNVRYEGEKHLIISSHSPFLISDLQREDVIALSVNNQLSPDTHNTFGANIHELLADNFFLQDGFMGDFSKNKIQDLIKYLNYNPNEPITEMNMKPNGNWSDESAFKLILIIGEPLIKERLMALFEKKSPSKIREIINAQIDELNIRLKNLK